MVYQEIKGATTITISILALILPVIIKKGYVMDAIQLGAITKNHIGFSITAMTIIADGFWDAANAVLY